MANPQIRIIDLPIASTVGSTYLTEYIPIESTAEGGRKISVYNFLSTGVSVYYYPRINSTDRAIATYNSSTSAFRDNPNASIDASGTITATGYRTTSSLRYKQIVSEIYGATQSIEQIRAVKFIWNENGLKNGKGTFGVETGLIAEDVQHILPHAIGYDKQGQVESLDYIKVIPLLLQSIKELNQRIKELEKR